MKTYFITGISSGLGKEIALKAFEQGDFVFGTTRSHKTAEEFNKLDKQRAKAIVLDLSNEDKINEAIAYAESFNGEIDVLINNAGYGITGAIEETSEQQAMDIFEINFFAPLRIIRAVLPNMRKNHHGHIINIGSISGIAAWMGTGIYGASKFALECVSRTLSQEIESLGINVTSVAPGGLRTNFSGTSLCDANIKIDDYNNTAHLARTILTDHLGQEPNDTGLAADTILKIAGTENPPKLLLLGEDAIKYAEHEIGFMTSEMEKWKDLTLSVAAKNVQ